MKNPQQFHVISWKFASKPLKILKQIPPKTLLESQKCRNTFPKLQWKCLSYSCKHPNRFAEISIKILESFKGHPSSQNSQFSKNVEKHFPSCHENTLKLQRKFPSKTKKSLKLKLHFPNFNKMPQKHLWTSNKFAENSLKFRNKLPTFP